MLDNTLSDWLRLREPADRASRSVKLTRAIAEATAVNDPAQVLDLASGTGSNVRFLVEHLPPRQRWLAVDRSTTLLGLMPVRTSEWGASRGYTVRTEANGCVIGDGGRLDCVVETRQLNLDNLEDADIFSGRHLVTASALLDLVSERWLRTLASRCRAAGAAALFTLTYDGRSSCSPAEPEDDMIRELLNRHQHTDKGLGGPAAGPDAAGRAVRCFTDAGYQVLSEPSDWVLMPDQRALQSELIDGWAEAAAELAPELASTIADWRERRIGHVNAGRSNIIVGHQDVAAHL